MANVQIQFETFDANIRLKRFEENATLREKRDIIREKLERRLPEVFEEHNKECPEFYFRDQGSYELGTGIKPLDGDFDIDQGLYFIVSKDEYPDPVILKERVFEALEGHTKGISIRRPCVTVFYQRDGEDIYHVDIAIYSDADANYDGKSYLAMGKRNSADEFRFWEVSDPAALTALIEDRFPSGPRRTQFRRIIRILKRWKDENFTSDGNAAPLGIGLTIVAYRYYTPRFSDELAGKLDDLSALRSMIVTLIREFHPVWDEESQQTVERLVMELPVEPWNDLFEQMTNKQMAALKEKLLELGTTLESAAVEVDPVEACQTLQGVLGDDFPVPTKEETAKTHGPSIVSSSNSA